MTDTSRFNSAGPGPEPTPAPGMVSHRIGELLEEWMPVAHKFMPAGTPADQWPAYAYALLEGLAMAAALPTRQQSAFLNAYRLAQAGQQDKLQALLERLPSDAPERQALRLLTSSKAQDQRRSLCLAAALEMTGPEPSGGPAPHAALPPCAVFGLQLWVEGFSYGQFMAALRAHQQHYAPEIEAETGATAPPLTAASSPPNLIHQFYRWVLERDGRWRRGDYAVVLDSRGAAVHIRGYAVQHYDSPLQAIAEANRQAQEAGHTEYSDEADVVDWLASLKMPEPEQVTWEPPGAGGPEGISRVAVIQHRGARYALLRNRLANTLALCPLKGEQTGAPLAISEIALETNWWIRKNRLGRKAIAAWMLKEAKL